MLVSRCCRTDVIVEGDIARYYACDRCGMACELIYILHTGENNGFRAEEQCDSNVD